MGSTKLHRRHPPTRLTLAAALLATTNIPATLLPNAALAQVNPPARAQPPAQASPQDPRWAAIRRVFGQEGKAEEGYFRIELPRSDLHVRIGDVTLEPHFELTTYFGFAPVGQNDVLAMGEVIMLQEEVNGALVEARRQGVDVAALHNHLLGENPRIMYMHVMTQGPAEAVATRLRSLASKTHVPLRPAEESQRATPDWSAIDAILGPHAEKEGMTASYIFRRREPHAVHGVPVRSTDMLETASEVVFQQLPGGRMACGGELFLRPEEVQPVIDALEAAGLHVTALHNHMLDEQPTMYWMHWFGTGEGTTMARGVAAAISKTNSERRSS
jgi:hypothetical protein